MKTSHQHRQELLLRASTASSSHSEGAAISLSAGHHNSRCRPRITCSSGDLGPEDGVRHPQCPQKEVQGELCPFPCAWLHLFWRPTSHTPAQSRTLLKIKSGAQ